jgi:putative membrane protein
MSDAFFEFLARYYLWFKALHLIGVIAWMAGLLYLPRLFVYHVGAPQGSVQSETFKIMERRLMRFIMTPAMLWSFAFGILLLLTPGVFVRPFGWLHLKLFLVLILAGMHGMLVKYMKDFERDQNQKSERFFRLLNEVPAVLMIFIIFLVVLKPF